MAGLAGLGGTAEPSGKVNAKTSSKQTAIRQKWLSGFSIGKLLTGCPWIGPAVAAPALITLLTQAMPVVQQVVTAIFKGSKPPDKPPVSTNITNLQTQTGGSMKELQSYMNQEQILATTVTSAGHASYQVAIINHLVMGRKTLSARDMAQFRTAWNSVKATLDAIAKAGINTGAMSDSYEKIVITRIIDADGDIKQDIVDFLDKYKPNGNDETSAAELEIAQTVVPELFKRFQDLSDVSGVVLKTVADALSAVVQVAVNNQPPSSTVRL